MSNDYENLNKNGLYKFLENGNIYCSGSNASGQLGMGTNLNEIHTLKLLPRGALQDEKIVKIACGESHSAILTGN